MRAIETIYQEMLAAYAERRGGQIEEDCELAVRLWAAAAQVQALEAQADWVLAQSFPQTAAGEYLDRHAAVRGLKRQAAAKSDGHSANSYTFSHLVVGADVGIGPYNHMRGYSRFLFCVTQNTGSRRESSGAGDSRDRRTI